MSGALGQLWQRLVLGDTDARVLAALRIGVGALAFLTLSERIPVITRGHSSAGWLPTDAAQALMDPFHWSVLHQVHSAAGVSVVLWLGVLAAVCFTVGLWSRLSAWATLVALVSINVRNPALLYGADNVTRLLVFYTALGPCGAAWSIDALRRRVRVARGSAESPGALSNRGRIALRTRAPVWPVHLAQIQVMLIYLTTGVIKLQGQTWYDYSALWYGLINPTYSRFNPGGVPLPEATLPLLTAFTFVALYWELLFPLLVLHPLGRRVALGTGLVVHGGIFVLLDIKWWGVVMPVSYLVFLSGRRLRGLELAVFRRLRHRTWDLRLTVQYAKGDPRARRAVATLAALDQLRLLRVVADGALEQGVRINDAHGNVVEGEATLRRLAGIVPTLVPAGLLTRVPLLGTVISRRAARALLAV